MDTYIFMNTLFLQYVGGYPLSVDGLPIVYVLIIAVMVLGGFFSWKVNQKFKQYSKIPLESGMTGREVAEKMLADNGIYDVTVLSRRGRLTDHYNPGDKTINLSDEVYRGSSVAAAAVAAHETGHAVQHATAYAPLQMRSALVPIVQFSSGIVQWILLIGVLMVQSIPQLLLVGIVLFGFTTLFSFVTLPVEIDASRRALSWLRSARITTGEQQSMAFTALKYAAYTYVVSAIGSLFTLIYYVLIYQRRR